MAENARTTYLGKEVEQIRKDLLNEKYNTFIKNVKEVVSDDPFKNTFCLSVDNEIYAKYFLLRLREEGVEANLKTVAGMCNNSYSIDIKLPMTFDIELETKDTEEE
tara:strand:+ start:363 stop:680 length:318 start_codon:yes stop_codon:yes gene_type:complete